MRGWLSAGLVAGAGLLVTDGATAGSGHAPVAGVDRKDQRPVATPDAGRDAESPLQSTQLAIDYELPLRMVCRPGRDLRLDVEAERVLLHGFTLVRGRAVKSYKDLAPGACAGLETRDNDVGDGKTPRYAVFGPKVTGPAIVQVGKAIHVEVSGGKVAKLAPGPNSWDGPSAPSSVDAPFASLVEWFRATDGTLEVSLLRNTTGDHGRFIVVLESGLHVHSLVKTTWNAPSYPPVPKPPQGAELNAEGGQIPRRALCRARADVTFRRRGDRIDTPAVPVPKRIVNVAADLRPGECAGAAVTGNDMGRGQYIPFGAAMTGPMVVEWGGSQRNEVGTPIPRIRPDGAMVEMLHGGGRDGAAVPSTVGARGFGSFLRWLQGTPGGMAVTFDRDTAQGGGPRFRLNTQALVELSEVR
jgi:hypothetical protein